MSDTLVVERFGMVRVFPEQIHTFWPLVKETIVDSFGSIYGSIDEAEVASIQSEIMVGNIQVFGIIERDTEALRPKKMVAIILTLISNEPILRKRSLVLVGIKSFGHIPASAKSNVLTGLINIARGEDCTIISCVTKNKRAIQLCRDNGFNCDIRWCFLEIGV